MRHGPALRRLAAVLALTGAGIAVGCSGDDEDAAGTPATSSTVAPATSTTSGAAASTRSVVVGGTGLLGWWDGTGWVDARDAIDAPPIAGGEEYLLVGLDDAITASRGAAPEPVEEFCSSPFVPLDPRLPDGPPGDRPWVAVHGVADPQPRPVATLDPEAEVYRAAAGEALADLGIDEDDPRLAQVVRADLSGDGTDEVLVVVEQIADPSGPYAEAGDYSLVLLRRLVGDEVRTTVVAQSLHEATDAPNPFIERLRVGAIADLNGDGAMELVLDAAYYEGGAVQVHELGPDGGFTQVMAAGCGV